MTGRLTEPLTYRTTCDHLGELWLPVYEFIWVRYFVCVVSVACSTNFIHCVGRCSGHKAAGEIVRRRCIVCTG